MVNKWQVQALPAPSLNGTAFVHPFLSLLLFHNNTMTGSTDPATDRSIDRCLFHNSTHRIQIDQCERPTSSNRAVVSIIYNRTNRDIICW
ncbi:unnamed protein product [Onchocerca flexuosa]|uniref:Secreted protein n=1 Tax=Onchocerca flexuosa TaxID=387005 RepID=A0A183HCW6_9BILA|nr:unnamed protein product [Onchocerca flexuosa]